MPVGLAYSKDAELQHAVNTNLDFKEDIRAGNASVWETATFSPKFRKIALCSVNSRDGSNVLISLSKHL